jgi:hypothetical protein
MKEVYYAFRETFERRLEIYFPSGMLWLSSFIPGIAYF